MNLEDAKEIIATTKEGEDARDYLNNRLDVFLEATSEINSICEDILISYVLNEKEYTSPQKVIHLPKGNFDNMCMKLDSYAQHHLANLGLSHYTTSNKIEIVTNDACSVIGIQLVVKFTKVVR